MPLRPLQRLLIVKTSSLGDVVHALPALTDIRAAHPECQVDWVVEQSFADIPRLHPGVHDVIPVALRRWKKSLLSAATRKDIRAFRQRIQQPRYDLVLDLQGLIKSAWVARQASGPRAGYDRQSIREPLAALAYHHRFSVSRGAHAVDRNRLLAAAALGHTLAERPLDYGLTVLQKNPTGAAAAPSEQRIALLTATSRDDKLWPENHWIALGKTLAAAGYICLLPAGSEAERERASRIAAGVPGATVLPPSSITDLAKHLGHCVGAVGVDTGLTHLAAAIGLPTVALYTATEPGLTGVLSAHPYRNLGGKGLIPAPEEVAKALRDCGLALNR